MMYTDGELISVKSAARALNRSEQTVRNMADRRLLPSIRTADGQRLFRLKDIEAEAQKKHQK